jgi:hypothetical protein
VFTGDNEGELVKVLCGRKFDARYPGFEFTPLDEGLATTVTWFAETCSPSRRGAGPLDVVQ